MAKVCEITGKKIMTGNTVSHSKKRMSRKFYPNLQKKKFYLPDEDKTVVLTVSTHGMKVIAKKGITQAIKDAKEKGYYKH